MRYIFLTYATGSIASEKIAPLIYNSAEIDRSDDNGSYSKIIGGVTWGPNSNWGTWFRDLDQHTKDECEAEFNSPFMTSGNTRLIKSSMFFYHIDFMKKSWPDCRIVVVTEDKNALLRNFIKKYNTIYDNSDHSVAVDKIWAEINDQMLAASNISNTNYIIASSSIELCELLEITHPPDMQVLDWPVLDWPILRTSVLVF
jgi:hypothetical protein